MMVFAQKSRIEETMNSTILQLARTSIAGILIVLLTAPLVQAAPIQGQQTQSQTQPAPPLPTQQQTSGTPDMNPQNAPEAPTPQLAVPATHSSNLQSDPQQNNNPVGTAAATHSFRAIIRREFSNTHEHGG